MDTVEIRASEGGADAEAFAHDLTSALHRALTREQVDASNDLNGILIRQGSPRWL